MYALFLRRGDIRHGQHHLINQELKVGYNLKMCGHV
jgi:hypothetical protein